MVDAEKWRKAAKWNGMYVYLSVPKPTANYLDLVGKDSLEPI